MDLPNLPRRAKQYETRFNEDVFAPWIKKNPRFSSALEMKDTRGASSLSFSEVADAQLNWARDISSDKGTLIRVQGLSGQPDYIWARNMPVYIVIRYPKFFCLISYGNFIQEKKASKRKSLTNIRATQIADVIIQIK